MDPKEIKSHLKAAREAISQKDFKEAIKHCKSILKVDKNHYNALVFVGVAAEGLEQADQARMAYQKAIETDGTQALAWQGLCGFYEKTGTNHKELLPIYEKLLEFRKGDETKSAAMKTKLAVCLQTLGEYVKALGFVKEIIDQTKYDEVSTEMWKQYIQLSTLCSAVVVNNKLLTIAFGKCLNSNEISNDKKCELHQQFIAHLCKSGGSTDEIKQECSKMKDLHTDRLYPREILCHILLYGVSGAEIKPIDCSNADKELENLSPENAFVLFLKAAENLRANTPHAARDLLMKGLKSEPSVAPAWSLLAQVHIALRDAQAATKCLTKAEGLLKKTTSCLFGFDKSVLDGHMALLSAQSMALNKDPVSLQQAVELCQQVLKQNEHNVKVLEMITELHIQLNQWQDALTFAVRLKEHNEAKSLLFEGIININTEQYDQAQQKLQAVLEQDTGHALALFYMGKLYWYQLTTDPQMASPCYDYLLKAAKSDSYNAACFLYLGHYQTQILKDLQKGLKCYQKSYKLNPLCEETGISLVDAYNATEQQDLALEVLQSVTSRASAGECKWAWLRLGLHQMKHEEPNLAITSLQSALRADPCDHHCYECLGEAYLQRGSYTAALKAFTRATELQPDNTYSFYQIGSIKLTLGNYTEAIEDYTTILNSTPDYVPALKGIGECYLHLEKASIKEFMHGRAVSHCQTAIQFLTRAAQKKPQFACLWKLLGDCLCELHVIPPDVCTVQAPALLLGTGHTIVDVTKLYKADVLTLGARCYGMALKCEPSCSALWHDLGLAYMHQARIADKTGAKLHMNKAFQSIERAIQLDNNNHAYWNTLGLVALAKELNNKALAQHCFIKSIQCEQNNVVAWTNLGVLYLQADDVTLAHEAFKVAQSLEPSYVASWIGQALIAETVGQSEEAMDLFRHTTELAHHTEGALGYAQFVCTLLQDTDKMSTDWNKYVIEQMWAVPAASDVMAKYTDRVRTNPTAFNLYGLLLERQRLYRDSARAFCTAVQLLRSHSTRTPHLRQASVNLARVLVHNEEFEKAVKIYLEFKPITLEEQCSYALALYKMQHYDASIAQYESALTLVTSQLDKSHIYAAMGMVTYRAGVKATGSADVDGAKNVLFKCIQTKPASVHGLNALLSLGLIQSDLTLASAVVTELEKFDEQRLSEDYTYMLASLHALKGDLTSGKRALSRLVHLYPNKAQSWGYLAQYLLTHQTEINDTVARCCHLALHHDITHAHKNLHMWLAVALLGSGQHSRSISTRDSHTAAQRAVLLHPDNLESWIALIGSTYGELITRRCLNKQENLAEPLLKLITHFMAKVEGLLSEKSGNTARLQALHLWCVKQYVVALLAANRQEQAQEFLNQALWLYDENVHLQNLLAYINQNFSVLKVNAINDSQGFTRLILVQLYMTHGLVQEAETILKMWLPQARTRPRKILALVRLAFFAFKQIISKCSNTDDMQKLFSEACSEVLRIDKQTVVVHFMMAALALFQHKHKQSKKSLQECLNYYDDKQNFTYGRELASQLLERFIDKEQQQVSIKKEQVAVQKDPFDD